MLLALPFDARSQLAGALLDGLDVRAGSQPALAAGRLGCKALCRVIDDGLQSLRLNVLPDTDQGPAPSLSRFPNVTCLAFSIDADWEEPGTDSSGSFDLLPGEQPAPTFKSRFANHAYPPSLLLWPLQGQPLECRQRLRNLALLGQLTSFKSMCQQLPAALTTANAAASAAGSEEVTRTDSEDDSESTDESDSSDSYDTYDSLAGASCTANAAGSEGCGSCGAGGGSSCSLAHLDLGNVRFPLTSARSKSVARGHAALGPLGLQELTLGVELLPGVQAHKVGGEEA